jgi:hypothetical protein
MFFNIKSVYSIFCIRKFSNQTDIKTNFTLKYKKGYARLVFVTYKNSIPPTSVGQEVARGVENRLQDEVIHYINRKARSLCFKTRKRGPYQVWLLTGLRSLVSEP